MKCPDDHTDLAAAKHSGVEMEICPACKGMWLTRQELNALEDEIFDLGDNEKGSLMLGSSADARECPECGKPMKRFQYRLYDLEMDFCEDGHG
ncbi:MAG: zf-TFIIB domain-containing protein, partial [Rhizomicrobium sp.]